MTGYTIFGTDTGVGKTVVAAALAVALRAAGHDVRVIKPVQTGAGEDDDAAEVDRLAGAGISHTGRRLVAPLAPSVAARLEGVRLDAAQLVAWVGETAGATTALVETAGGCSVEIREGYDMADLGADLGLPALLVCHGRLGTLNHARLSVDWLQRKGVAVTGLIVSGVPQQEDWTLLERTNVDELPRLCGVPVAGVLPRFDLSSGATITPEEVRGIFSLPGLDGGSR